MKRCLLLSLLLLGSTAVPFAQLQTIPYGVALPPYPDSALGPPSFTLCTIDAVDEECAYIFTASTTKNLHTIYFPTNNVTTGATVDVRVEGVSLTTGDPDDTLVATNTNASVVIDNADDNVWKTATLTADASLTRGNIYAIVVKGPGAGTPNLTIDGFGEETPEGMPYRDFFSATWAKATNSLPIFLLEYSDGTYEPQLGFTGSGLNATTAISFNTGTTTTRECNELTLAFASRATGAWGWVDGDGAFKLELRDSAGTTTLAASLTQDPDVRPQTTAGLYYLPFTATYTLVANTTYQVCAVPTTTTSISTYRFSVPAAAAMGSFSGGTAIYRTNNDSGDVTTDRAYLGVFLDQFSNLTSAGSPGIIE